MTATLLPPAEVTFTDSNGKPLAGGSVFFYVPGTSTFKSTYQDSAQTILNTNPVILDASGRAIIWGSGSYRQVVYDQFNNLVWDQITQDANTGLTGNITDARFVSGSDFTPGTTTQLTLPAGPGAPSNMWVFFDGTFQSDDQYTINGVTLTFSSPIPIGVQEVNVKIGNTVAIGTPGAATVTGASLNVSGAGVFTPAINFAYNPSSLTSWTGEKSQNLEGIGVDIGSYGTRSFGGFSIPTAVSGAINIPGISTLYGQGVGVAGYSKSASTTTGAVPLFGQGDSEAAGALAWGINTVTKDNGNQTTIWGAEIDLNISNVATAGFGVNVVGGSTVEPPSGTYGFWVGPLGTFSSPPKRWAKGLFVDDGAAMVGVEIGSATPAGTTGGSQSLDMYYQPSTSGRSMGARIQTDISGNLNIAQAQSGPALYLTAGGVPGAGSNKVLFTGICSGGVPALSFFGAVPISPRNGFGAPTGAALTANFPGNTATLAQCGSMISWIINQFLQYGLFQA